MKSVFTGWALATAMAVGCWTFPAHAGSKEVVPPEAAANVVDVSNAEFSHDGAVCGTLTNKSDHPVRDIQLVVRHQWLWSNERHPGKDYPGRASRITVADEIPPGGSVPFNHCASPPLPDRSDGQFKTSIEVIGFSEVGDAPAPLAGACRCDATRDQVRR